MCISAAALKLRSRSIAGTATAPVPENFPHDDRCYGSSMVDKGFSPNCARMVAEKPSPEMGPSGTSGCSLDIVGVYEARGAEVSELAVTCEIFLRM